MKRKLLYAVIAFLLIFVVHALYCIEKVSRISQQWAQLADVSPFLSYFQRQDFFLSYSYALAGGFTIYALLKFLENRRSGVTSIVGGVTLTGILYAGGCFLLGCCGSPMLGVYIGLFGSSLLGFAKPLMAAIITLAVVIAYLRTEKKRTGCCKES